MQILSTWKLLKLQGEKIIGMGLLDLYINPNDLPGCDPDEIVGYLKEFLTTKVPESKRTFRWDVPIPGTKKAHQILECGKLARFGY